MRIDIDANAIKQSIPMQTETSAEKHELNTKGEYVKGRIIDVNENMVVIQTSTGKTYSAKTTVPMENYLGHDVSFGMYVGSDGEIILVPKLGENEARIQELLKVQDILIKLNQPFNEGNKEIILAMMKGKMAITKENFENVKDLKFALSLLKDDNFLINLSSSDKRENIDELIKIMQNKKDYGIANKNLGDFVVPQNTKIEDLIILKNLGMKVSINNINALKNLFSSIKDGKTDFLGIFEKLNEDFKNLNDNIGKKLDNNEKNNSLENSKPLNKSEINEPLNNNEKNSLNQGNEIKKGEILKENVGKEIKFVFDDFKNEGLKEFSKLTENIDKLGNLKDLGKEDLKLVLNHLKDSLIKVIDEKKINQNIVLRQEYEKVKRELSDIIEKTEKNLENGKAQNLDYLKENLLPKFEILDNLQKKYDYNIINFKVFKDYENKVEYYVKKRSKNLKKGNEINIGISINTKKRGLVLSSLNYKENKDLSIVFITENKYAKNFLEKRFPLLEKNLALLGFRNLKLVAKVDKKEKSILEEAIYSEKNKNSIEYYV